MFGIGLGEIILILFIVFLISPRDIPKVMRKLGQLFGALRKLRDEVADIEHEVRDVAAEIRETGGMIKRPAAAERGPAPGIKTQARAAAPAGGRARRTRPAKKAKRASR